MPDHYTAWYPFIRPDVFLIAQVEKISGKQRLIMHKVDPVSGKIVLENAIDCIHTAVGDIPVDEFEDTVEDPEFGEKVLHIRSTERLTEIKLSPEEKFKAFKSWVAGIAEAGMAAFVIQGEIDKVANLQYPISLPLLRFMAIVDTTFLPSYVQYIEEHCECAAGRHGAFLIANLLPIFELLLKEPTGTGLSNALEVVLSIDPPLELFVKNEKIFQLCVKNTRGFLSYFLERMELEYEDIPPPLGGFVIDQVLDTIIGEKVQSAELTKVIKQFLSIDDVIKRLVGDPAIFRNLAYKYDEFLLLFLDRVQIDLSSRGPRVMGDAWSSTVILLVLNEITRVPNDDALEILMSMELPVELYSRDPAIFKKLFKIYHSFLPFFLQRIQVEWKGDHASDNKWLNSVMKDLFKTLDQRNRHDVAEFILQMDIPAEYFTVGLERRIYPSRGTPRLASNAGLVPINGNYTAKYLPRLLQTLRDSVISVGDVIYLKFFEFQAFFLVKKITPRLRAAWIVPSTRLQILTLSPEKVTKFLEKCEIHTLLVLFGIVDEVRRNPNLFTSFNDTYTSYKFGCKQYNQIPLDIPNFKLEIRHLCRAGLVYKSRSDLMLLTSSSRELQSFVTLHLTDYFTRKFKKEIAGITVALSTRSIDPRFSLEPLSDILPDFLKIGQNKWKPPKKVLKILLLGEELGEPQLPTNTSGVLLLLIHR